MYKLLFAVKSSVVSTAIILNFRLILDKVNVEIWHHVSPLSPMCTLLLFTVTHTKCFSLTGNHHVYMSCETYKVRSTQRNKMMQYSIKNCNQTESVNKFLNGKKETVTLQGKYKSQQNMPQNENNSKLCTH
jgi:hypothetical protein